MSECPAVLSIKGQDFPCDWPTDENGDHRGWAHSNRDAEAIWRGYWDDDPRPFVGEEASR